MRHLDGHSHPVNPIAFRRSLAKMTQQDLSIKSGVKLATIQKLESGANSLLGAKSETLLLLSRALGCRMEDLLDGLV